jgi:ornithine cyclodeaminase
MKHFGDEEVESLLDAEAAQAALLDAFRSFAAGQAAMQRRVRTEVAGVKLSTLGAVLPEQGVAGAKVYTTIGGRFSFVVILFDARTGQPLATFDAGALTRLRTAATTVLAARALARASPRRLAVFGLGTQGREHVRQLARAFDLRTVAVHSPHASATDVAALPAPRRDRGGRLARASDERDR